MDNTNEKRIEKDGLIFFGRMAEVASLMDDAEMDFFKLCDSISDQISDYMEMSDISKAELAKRMKNSRPFVTKILSGDMNITLKTLTKILHHLGLKAEVKLVEKGQHVSWFGVVKDLSSTQGRYIPPANSEVVSKVSGVVKTPKLTIFGKVA